jgi:hypothetical protein
VRSLVASMSLLLNTVQKQRLYDTIGSIIPSTHLKTPSLWSNGRVCRGGRHERVVVQGSRATSDHYREEYNRTQEPLRKPISKEVCV